MVVANQPHRVRDLIDKSNEQFYFHPVHIDKPKVAVREKPLILTTKLSSYFLYSMKPYFMRRDEKERQPDSNGEHAEY